ncbi:YqaJ viral recombinase family protein [Streptomyces sp. A3M-1-3]|uniref:YqaJ viral recombinase family nuclease n=1 Tax=Streptomyces sp. A3M-1-3 TaxID=2962044 RepID=UPI0020B8F48A|nr:YqaJ viral recombinase family protein [Streptomyces sp. A3M-1-3]MCP3820117.1 YqaJ viral recombinase family protein [Streptomyces sp. A3M-1-3]
MTEIQTPTGVLLGRYTPGTPEWDAARAGLCITATEIAAVLGLSPWQSRFSLWHKKAGLPSPPFVTSPEMKWGSRLEDDVFEEFDEQHPEYLVMETGTWRHRDREWQRATPDRLLAIREGGASDMVPIRIGEAKTSPWGDHWGPAGSDEIPVYYRAQVIWQQDTLGLLDPAHIAVLISGHDYREYTVEYDAADAELMRKAAREFLDDVAAGVRPPIDDSTATYQTVRMQPEGREDVDVEIPGPLRDRYFAALDGAEAASAELTGARSEVLDHIGNGKRAVCLGQTVATRTVRGGKTHSLQPAKNRSNTA